MASYHLPLVMMVSIIMQCLNVKSPVARLKEGFGFVISSRPEVKGAFSTVSYPIGPTFFRNWKQNVIVSLCVCDMDGTVKSVTNRVNSERLTTSRPQFSTRTIVRLQLDLV